MLHDYLDRFHFDFSDLQEVSSMLLDKLVAAGIGDRPVVFVTHRRVNIFNINRNIRIC